MTDWGSYYTRMKRERPEDYEKKTKLITEWRRKKRIENRERAVAYLGGRCARCGYNKCINALIFHHHEKEGISHYEKKLVEYKKVSDLINSCRTWKSIETELKKCTLICLNCHAEAHFATGKRGL
jgi:hypothetical protein